MCGQKYPEDIIAMLTEYYGIVNRTFYPHALGAKINRNVTPMFRQCYRNVTRGLFSGGNEKSFIDA